MKGDIMTAGLHIVKKARKGKPVTWYVYAWRGGPQILKKEGGEKPKVTSELTDKAAEKRTERPEQAVGTIANLIDRYAVSGEWKKLSKSTRTDYTTWHGRIVEKFGKARLGAFTDRRVRSDVLEWRDKWADQPRSADAGITAFSALLTWAVDRGMIAHHVLLGIDRLYESDRSDIIWETHHFEMVRPHASVEVLEGIDLAAATGLRRGDLVKLPWTAIGEHAIVWRTGKSRGKNVINVPLLPEAKAVLARIKARHEAEMAQTRKSRRKPLPATVLSNSFWRPWTPKGFGSRFNDAKQASKIDVNFHDLRGTFATKLMIGGLTDEEIADILGWSSKDVSTIRMKYVSQTRIVVALGERLNSIKAAG